MAAYEEQDYNKPFSFKVWGKMLPFFKPYKKFFAISLGLNIFLAGIDSVPELRYRPLYYRGKPCRDWTVCSGLRGCHRDPDVVRLFFCPGGYHHRDERGKGFKMGAV